MINLKRLQRNKKVEAGVKGFHVSHYVPPAAAAETDDNEDDASSAASFPCQSDSECEDAESSHDLSNAEANSNMQEQPIHDRVKKGECYCVLWNLSCSLHPNF